MGEVSGHKVVQVKTLLILTTAQHLASEMRRCSWLQGGSLLNVGRLTWQEMLTQVAACTQFVVILATQFGQCWCKCKCKKQLCDRFGQCSRKWLGVCGCCGGCKWL